MYLSTWMCVYVDNMTCKWHWTISTQWQDEDDEVEFQEDSDQDVSDDFDGDTSQSLIDSETNSLSNSTGWRKGATYHRLPQGILGKKLKPWALSGQRPQSFPELWMFSKCGFPVPHFFLQLDFSGDSDQNGGPPGHDPPLTFFLRPGRRECPATIRIMWELPRSEMGIVTTI